MEGSNSSLAGGCNVGNRFCGGAGKESGWRGATAVWQVDVMWEIGSVAELEREAGGGEQQQSGRWM